MTDSVRVTARHDSAGWPLLSIAVEPQTGADYEKLSMALGYMAEEDPSLRFSIDPESGFTMIHGDSEVYLDGVIGALKVTWGVVLNVGAPQVAYRETLTRKTQIDYTHRALAHVPRQLPGVKMMVTPSAPVNQFARVVMVFEPGAPGSGFSFSSEAELSVPKAFVPAVARGLETARQDGLLAGYPVIDVRATLIDGAYHDLDSSVVTFAIAARDGFKSLREKGGVTLVEPMMTVEVRTPRDRLDRVVTDIERRRGRMQAHDVRNGTATVQAIAPLEEMLGYGRALRAMSEGRAHFTMNYDHYAPAPTTTPSDGNFPPAVGMRA